MGLDRQSVPARIAFVHTVGFLVDLFRKACADSLPAVDVFHILNESLLQDLLKDGPSPGITNRVVRQALLAADAGADIVIFTCSSTSSMVDVARAMCKVPILKVDEPMAIAAIAAGKRIGLLCTAQSTVGPSTQLLTAVAVAAGKTIEIIPSLVAGAYDALFRGDRAAHDGLVTAAAERLAPQCDVLVLAQVSLAHLEETIADHCGKPVFASPPILMDRLRHDIAALKGE